MKGYSVEYSAGAHLHPAAALFAAETPEEAVEKLRAEFPGFSLSVGRIEPREFPEDEE